METRYRVGWKRIRGMKRWFVVKGDVVVYPSNKEGAYGKKECTDHVSYMQGLFS